MILLDAKVFAPVTSATQIPDLAGKLDIGLAKSGSIIYNTVSWIHVVIQFNIVFRSSSSAVLLDYNLGNFE
jgi:hypothetical protein